MRQSWIKVMAVNLFLTVLSGIVLRWLFVENIPFIHFINLMHAHSHIGVLGWLYIGIILVLFHIYIRNLHNRRGATFIFWFTQTVVIGMFIAFILQGYGIISILFSSMHVITSYFFAFYLFKELRRDPYRSLQKTSTLLIKGSLFFLTISSIGPWSLAYWNAMNLPKGITYDLIIHTYLHFQINGWITLSLLGILLYFIEKRGTSYSTPLIKRGFWLYSFSLFPSLLLTVDWTQITIWLLPVAVIGWLMKIIGISSIIFGILKTSTLSNLFGRGWAKLFAAISLLSLFSKTIVEAGNTLPFLMEYTMSIRHIVIGYLHLGLIGFASFLLLAFFIHLNWIKEKGNFSGFILILLGFALYEVFLFGDGMFYWITEVHIVVIYLLLFISTIFILLGVAHLLFARKAKS